MQLRRESLHHRRPRLLQPLRLIGYDQRIQVRECIAHPERQMQVQQVRPGLVGSFDSFRGDQIIQIGQQHVSLLRYHVCEQFLVVGGCPPSERERRPSQFGIAEQRSLQRNFRRPGLSVPHVEVRQAPVDVGGHRE